RFAVTLARPRRIGPRHRSHEGRYCVTPFKSTTNSRDVPRYSAASRPDTAYDWADGDIWVRRIFPVAAPSNDGPPTDHIADLPARWAVAVAHAPLPPSVRASLPSLRGWKRSFSGPQLGCDLVIDHSIGVANGATRSRFPGFAKNFLWRCVLRQMPQGQ